MKRTAFYLLLLLLPAFTGAQNIDYARKMLDKLASEHFYGRGYVNNGGKKAADFIVRQLKKRGLKPLGEDYFQPFSFPMNTFPYRMKLQVNKKELIPGEDYVVSCSSPSVSGNFNVKYLPDSATKVKTLLTFIGEEPDTGYFLVVPPALKKLYGTDVPFVKGMILLSDGQPFWHVSNGNKTGKTVWLKIKRSALKSHPEIITINIKNKFIPHFQTQNIAAYIPGKVHPDTFLVFSAHYDHLGMMGKRAVYHGANDNGSGTSMVLDLSAYYSLPENRPAYSVVFLFFAGEEAGLKGSQWFVQHPLIPLDNIKLLINLDMVGTGSEGIKVVNGSVYKEVFNKLKQINNSNKYVEAVKARGEACNSDHCPFYRKGIPSLFIYTLGKEHRQYHIPEDNTKDFPFTAYEGLFKLLTAYVKSLTP